MCFTETHTDIRSYTRIDEYLSGWKDIHNHIQHGLAICYNVSEVNIIEEFQTVHALEMLAVLVEIENERVLVVLVYRAPGPLRTFMNDLIEQLNNLPTREQRTVGVGDFNLDQNQIAILI